MSMKVLFISVNKVKSLRPVFPVGVVRVATHVRSKGYEVDVLDLCFESDDEMSVKNRVKEFSPDVVGISIRNVDSLNFLEPSFYPPFVLQVVNWCKETSPGIKILLGGAGFSHAPEEIMRYARAHFGIIGYGETSTTALLDKLSAGEPLDSTQGLIYFDKAGALRKNPPNYHYDRDGDCRIAREYYDKRYYAFEYMTQDSHTRCVESLQTKKGCGLHCIYCSNFKLEGHGVVTRPVKLVVDEMEDIIKNSVGQGFEIVDSVFNVPLSHAIDICREMKRRGINSPWACMLNPGAVTESLLSLMRETGCYKVEFGTDSCATEILRILGKTYTREDIIRAHHFTDRNDINIMHCVFLGAPGDNRETIFETLELLSQLVPDNPHSRHRVYLCLGLRIWDNTQLYDIALRDGLITSADDISFPIFYISPSLLGDEKLLDEVEEKVVKNSNWYLWWGLPNYSLKERIQQVTREFDKMREIYVKVKNAQISREKSHDALTGSTR